MSSARDIAHALGGRRAIRINDHSFLTCCPVASHGRRRGDLHPSLQVTDGDRRLLVRCYADCDARDVLDELRRRGLIEASTQIEQAPRVSSKPARDQEPEKRRRLELAVRIWREAGPIASSPGEAYLARRGIVLERVPDHGGLRFHSRCPWGDTTTACIIARFTNAVTGTAGGIWRRPINGDKPMTLGPMLGGVIRLWPDEDVTTGLVIGEGVETVLSAATRCTHKGTFLYPAWATGSAGNLERLPILSGIEGLTILVDNDANDVGQRAANRCAIRWQEAGRSVRRLTPRMSGTDFNDLVVQHDAATTV
jgi:Toprim domain